MTLAELWVMATRSEQFKAEEQRHAHGEKPPAQKREQLQNSAARPAASKGAGRKATQALEVSADDKRPSRKSTRKSANRAKAGHQLNLREKRIKTAAPESKHKKAAAKGETSMPSTGE